MDAEVAIAQAAARVVNDTVAIVKNLDRLDTDDPGFLDLLNEVVMASQNARGMISIVEQHLEWAMKRHSVDRRFTALLQFLRKPAPGPDAASTNNPNNRTPEPQHPDHPHPH